MLWEMDFDATLRLSFLLITGTGLAIFLLGGFVTPVAGRWRDGDRWVELNQLGPWLQGHAKRPGGSERYRGFAFFGQIWLARRSYGADHLRALGFAEDALPVVEGAMTAKLRFSRRGRRLEGSFTGIRFDFSDPPVRILKVGRVAATDRVWERG
ncbi:MAG: hypothetical protein AAFQ82_10900 [Myxococcota bacterium]